MKRYSARDDFREWDYLLVQDRINGGISAVKASALAKLPALKGEKGDTGAAGVGGSGSSAWIDITGRPSTFTPSTHAHGIADVTGLQTAIDGKQAALVSASNIKTINGQSILGAGDLSIAGGGGGVSSVGMSVPVGLSVSGSPVTGSGSIAVTYTAGYSIPTDANQANWSTAFGWGNHALAGYLGSGAIGVSVQGYNANTVIDAAYVHTDNNYTTAEALKLAGIASGATVNSPDATLLSRANHTGSQAQSTITGLTTDLAAKAPLSNPTFTGTVTLPEGQVVNGVTLTTAGGTSNFLRADGTYAAPPSGGSPILSWAI